MTNGDKALIKMTTDRIFPVGATKRQIARYWLGRAVKLSRSQRHAIVRHALRVHRANIGLYQMVTSGSI